MKARQRTAPKAPCQCRTRADIAAMPRTLVSRGEYWLMLADARTLLLTRCHQGADQPTDQVCISAHVFGEFARWFLTGEWPSKRRVKKGRARRA